MKINCSVLIGNRLLPGVAINSKKKHVRSTLALCKHPNLKDCCIIVFNAQHKTGMKYELKSITKVVTRFVNEGKVTIQFKVPQHDLYIQAEPILLKAFISLLKLAVENKPSELERLPLSNMSVTTSKPVVKKLVIQNRCEYPTKGFPRTLEVLHINNINSCSVSIGILQLTKLRILDLSHNCLENLPIELSNLMCLNELNMSHNQLGKARMLQWRWLNGNFLKTLKVLDLRNNSLRYLTNRLTLLENLTNLHVDCNELKCLPPRIGFLKCLQTFTASNNSITIVPSSFRRLSLQFLDLSENNWDHKLVLSNNFHPAEVKSLPMFSLKEHALRSVLNSKLSFTSDTLPHTVIEELQSAEYCRCGSACLSAFVKRLELLTLNTISFTVSISPVSSMFMPVESYFCSMKCFDNATFFQRKRMVR